MTGFAALLLAWHSTAADGARNRAYYVARGGNDSNPGTLAAPLASIAVALKKLQPGDRLVIRGGTYYPRAPLVVRRSGSRRNPITIEGYARERVRIDGRRRLSSLLRIEGASWVRVNRLVLTNTAENFAGTDKGLRVENARHVRLTNITVRHASEGIDISSSADHVAISGCDVSRGVIGIDVSGRHVLVERCTLHDLNRTGNNGLDCDGDASTGGDHGGQAIAADTTTGPIEIRNNRAWNNVARGRCWGNDGAFVELYHAQNVNVHHNSSSDGVVTFETAGDTSGIKLWRNRVRNESFLAGNQLNDILIANNTVWNTDGSHGVLIWVGPGNAYGNGSTAGLTLVNNIFASVGGMLQLARDWDATVTVDHNAYHLVDGGWFGMIAGRDFDSFADYRSATGRETNSIAADPLLVDPANDDFRVGAGSPAIAAGTAVAGVTDALTAAPDMGAVERSALSP